MEDEEGLETEAIHVMFYIEVYVVALGSSVNCFYNSWETYCVQCIHLRAILITELYAP